MVTKQQMSAIKEIAGRLAWNNIWHYQDQTNRTIVFVIEVGPGRTVSHWHLSKLVEEIEGIRGPGRAFIIQGLEETPPDTWLETQAL